MLTIVSMRLRSVTVLGRKICRGMKTSVPGRSPPLEVTVLLSRILAWPLEMGTLRFQRHSGGQGVPLNSREMDVTTSRTSRGVCDRYGSG